MYKIILASAITMSCVGCASIVNETTQPVKLETADAGGKLINGAACKLTNDYGVVTTSSGNTAQVHRSNKDLEITCTSTENPDATARAISRANAGLAGNILIGGGIGAVVDHARGTAYTYPTWVRLVFGKSLVFDRRAEKDGSPVVGVDEGAKEKIEVAKK